MNTCYIALGSNLDHPLQQVTRAIPHINTLGHITAQSSWYKSTAIGPGKQPDYINGVVCLETLLSAHELLAALQDIEKLHGRQRDIRWGARTLDLDILLFNDDTLSTEDLVIPHPRMFERNFVMYPLYEIAPNLAFPNHTNIFTIINSLLSQGLEKLHQNS